MLRLAGRRTSRSLRDNLRQPAARNAVILAVVLTTFAVCGLKPLLSLGSDGFWGTAVAQQAVQSPPLPSSAWMSGIVQNALNNNGFAPGRMRDFLLLLGSTAVGIPLVQRLGVSSKVLGFLAIGVVIGPSGFALISDLAWSEMLAEAGIVFFLCEMGLELSFDRLSKMRRDVFGLGFAQFGLTSLVIFIVSSCIIGMNTVQSAILGMALALSSSAFALQLLDETGERGTLHGRSAFGILLFQDLVVPVLLVLVPMLNQGSGMMLVSAIQRALTNGFIALALVLVTGRLFLGNLFSFVAQTKNSVALRALSFVVVLGMCYIFMVFGLSNTLGAFMAGVLLAETAFREQVEEVIAPIREDLLGLFFVTVGFGIDLSLVITKPMMVLSTVSAVLLCKTFVTTLACRLFGLSGANAQQVGFILSQAGEFSFVMFGIAGSAGVFSPAQVKLLLTMTSVSMTCTPFLTSIGRDLGRYLQTGQQQSMESNETFRETARDAQVIVFGYDKVGGLIAQMMDTKFIRWMALERRQKVVTAARSKDLPVFPGGLMEAVAALQGCDISNKLAVISFDDHDRTLRLANGLKNALPELRLMAWCSQSDKEVEELRECGVKVVTPDKQGDPLLLNLPMGATVLRALGSSAEDAEGVVDEIRRERLDEEKRRRKKASSKKALKKPDQIPPRAPQAESVPAPPAAAPKETDATASTSANEPGEKEGLGEASSAAKKDKDAEEPDVHEFL